MSSEKALRGPRHEICSKWSRPSRPNPSPDSEEEKVSSHVDSISEIVGSSPDTVEAAIENALARAHKTIRNLDWFQMTEVRGHISPDGKVDHYQVALKVGFRMEG